MYLCLGAEAAADLGKALRDSGDDRDVVAAIREAVAQKPKGHAFGSSEARAPRASARPISLTGGWAPDPPPRLTAEARQSTAAMTSDALITAGKAARFTFS